MTACPRSGVPLVCPETYESKNEPPYITTVTAFTSSINIKIIHIFATECIYVLRMARRISDEFFPLNNMCLQERGRWQVPST